MPCESLLSNVKTVLHTVSRVSCYMKQSVQRSHDQLMSMSLSQERALGTRPMEDVLSQRLADVMPPHPPGARAARPAPFAIERGFAEVRCPPHFAALLVFISAGIAAA